MSGLVRRMLRRPLTMVAVLVAVAVLAAGAVVLRPFGGDGTYRITARFSVTPGLYADNTVDILGVPTGHVVSVTPKPGYVEVTMSLPRHVKIPADARAVLMAPNPVSDRFVELSPAYTSGAVMAPDSVIPLQRSVVPLELDQVYESIDSLASALGPSGANSRGDLSAALHALAGLANGNGASAHTAITALAAALPALTEHPDDLKNLIDGLDGLTRSLAARSGSIDALYGDLASATRELADERATIAAAVANLQRGLAQAAAFIKANAGHIGGSVKNLTTVISAIMNEQAALAKSFDNTPLGFQNVNAAISTHVNCTDRKATDCAAAWGRIDMPRSVLNLIKAYCGDNATQSILPILQANAGLGGGSAKDTACAAQFGLLQGHAATPNAPATPDLDLTHYLGTR